MHPFSIIKLMEKTLNYVDPRLMNHGKRVAYLVYKVLKRQNAFTDEKMLQTAILALLHDIGAYKTEEIDKLVQFETEKVWEHSVYGYLFIKHFSPLSHLAPVLLFHHANCQELTHLHAAFHEQAQLIFIADRLDVLIQTNEMANDTIKQYFQQKRNILFEGKYLDMFFFDGWESLFQGMEEDTVFNHLLYYSYIPEEDIQAYIKMIALTIDFRSPQTVTHTFTSACICRFIAKRIQINPDEANKIYIGTMLHDLGKIGIPLEILEKNGRLTPNEMKIMETHVVLTKKILTNDIDTTTLNLSVRHHEKLDGSGYPLGLTKNDLTMGQRLIAVADIFSALIGTRTYKEAYPKEKVISILQDMSSKNLIDEYIVSVVEQFYESLMVEVEKNTAPILESYKQIQQEYEDLLCIANNFHCTAGQGEIHE